ncbi:MAG: hypothetical protein FWC46_05965 [Actinomycetia bacterium]|nr:hypothetical protein [Actinomycetes bacterium]
MYTYSKKLVVIRPGSILPGQDTSNQCLVFEPTPGSGMCSYTCYAKAYPLMYRHPEAMFPCDDPPPVSSLPGGKPVIETVYEAVAKLKLPDGTPVISPDPMRNEWHMLAVNYPIWLSTNADASMSASVTQDGIRVSMTATRGTTKFHLEAPGRDKYGHDDRRYDVTCTSMAKRLPRETPADKPSPDCGVVIKHVGEYEVSAVTTWHVDWTADAYSGRFDVTREAAMAGTLTIDELRAVIVGYGDPTETAGG